MIKELFSFIMTIWHSTILKHTSKFSAHQPHSLWVPVLAHLILVEYAWNAFIVRFNKLIHLFTLLNYEHFSSKFLKQSTHILKEKCPLYLINHAIIMFHLLLIISEVNSLHAVLQAQTTDFKVTYLTFVF